MSSTGRNLHLPRVLENVGEAWRGAVLTIGNFDGVHLGHRAILARARETAKRLNTQVVAMTFEPHPIAILAPDRAPPTLTPLEKKLELLQWSFEQGGLYGADAVFVIPIDRNFLDITAEEFVREILIQQFAPKAIVEGPTFNFGRDRAGSNETLRQFAKEGGYEVDIVEAKQIKTADGKQLTVSSSTIRSLLAAGNVADAGRCLGRHYQLSGPVIRGAGVGRLLDYPTINLDVTAQQIPAEGVYVGFAMGGRVISRAAISIGRRETFGQHKLVVEAFLLDVQQDLYDKVVQLDFRKRIRDQKRFDHASELKEQIAKDVQQVRESTMDMYTNPAVPGLAPTSRYEFAARFLHNPLYKTKHMIVTHARPDGDALGSTVGLYRVLTELGRDVKIVLYEDVPPRYAFVVEGVPYSRWGKDINVADVEADRQIVIVDTSSWQQLEPVAPFLKGHPHKFVIDHHKTRDRVSDIELIDENAPAAALIVWKICKAAGWPVSKEAAEALFVGLATDTGWFRFSNTNAEALAAAAEMTELGVNPAELYQRIYLSDPAARVRLLARVLGEFKLFADDRVALQTLSRKTLAECGATDAMTEEIVNEPMRIATVNVSVFCSEAADNGPVRVNLRSKHGVDVAALARQFGGGGHERAAGARIPGTLDEVAKKVVDAVIAELKD